MLIVEFCDVFSPSLCDSQWPHTIYPRGGLRMATLRYLQECADGRWNFRLFVLVRFVVQCAVPDAENIHTWKVQLSPSYKHDILLSMDIDNIFILNLRNIVFKFSTCIHELGMYDADFVCPYPPANLGIRELFELHIRSRNFLWAVVCSTVVWTE